INDNGTGTAAVLETALQLRRTKIDKKLQRPVRFAFWGAEEAGLLGSQHYVDSLTDLQRSRIYANLNFDMLGSPNYVRFVYDGNGSASDLGGEAGPAGSAQIERVFTNYYGSKKLATAPTAFDGRSDYGPFIEYGIPAGGLFSGAEGVKTEAEAATYGGVAGEAYDACYHQACDDITNLSTKAMSELGDGAAYATVRIAQSKLGLYGDAGTRRATKSKASVKAKGARARAHGEHSLRR
ncbi:MAG: M28 family peptidase, partial [Actinomycetales bacterium]